MQDKTTHKIVLKARKLGEKVANDDDKQWLFTNLDEIAVMINGE
jgi:hypothetical protein